MSKTSTAIGIVAFALALVTGHAAATEPTGPMAFARSYHTASSLPGARVLITGGRILAVDSVVPTASAEIYDSATNTFSPTGPLAIPRAEHGAATLHDGRIIALGGRGPGFGVLTSAEIYDPATGAWSLTGPMRSGRFSPIVITIQDGRVLVIGGASDPSTCEIFDPATGTFSDTGSLLDGREGKTAVLLDDGRVLAVGTLAQRNGAQVWNPSTGLWTSITPTFFTRDGATATKLPDGTVLVAGGELSDQAQPSQIFDPPADEFVQTGSPAIGRNLHTATLLAGTGVFVTGGSSGSQRLDSIERYDIASGTWSPAGRMSVTRWVHTATPLPNGNVLLVGDFPNPAMAELFVPACASAATISPDGVRIPGIGGTGSVAVTHQAGCYWAVSNVPEWVTIISGAAGRGNGTVTFSATRNPGDERTSTGMRVADKDFTIIQAQDPCIGATPTVSPPSLSLSSPGGARTLSVSQVAGCPWTVTNIPEWITFPAGTSGTGNATLTAVVAPNPGPLRTAQLLIGTRSYTVTQSASPCVAALASLSPTNASFDAGGGSGSVFVSQVAGCPWDVRNVPAWITITSGSPGTGSGTVAYSAAANPGASRIATLSIAGAAFVVTQAANSCFAAIPVTPGVAYNGTLSATDCTAGARGSRYYTDRYSVEVQPGQRLAVLLSSHAFDTYLYVRAPNGAVIFSDDDSGPGTNSRVPDNGYINVPRGVTGTYVIEVTSNRQRAVGSYTLLLTQP